MTSAAGVQRARTDGASAVFASFRLGDGEFAVDVQRVQEVVRLPADLLAMPLLPSYALGVFNLRGTIIPLLCTRQLLGQERGALAAEAKVAIVHHRGVRLGLVCDDTSRVLRPTPDEYTPVRYTEGSERTVATGVLKMPDGLIPVVDLDALLALKEIPFGDTESGDVAKRRALRARKRCITFRVGRTWMALPIAEFHEILRTDTLEAVPLADPVARGVLRRRGRVIPVVDLATILDASLASADTIPTHGDDSRVIVLAIGVQLVGFLVDAVEAIEGYHEDELMGVPALTARRGRVYAGSLELGAHGLVFLLNRAGLAADEEVGRISVQYGTLFNAGEASAASESVAARGSMKSAYLWFRAHADFALPMRAIREIVEVSDALIPVPGAPDCVRGMLNLRGRIVTVMDARMFLSLPRDDGEADAERKILVLDEDDTLVGFCVDRVESILHVAAHERFEIPAMVRAQLPRSLRDDIREVLRITAGADPQQRDLLVLDARRLMEMVREERDVDAMAGAGSEA